MTLALIVLIIFLVVWLNQKADIQKKKSQHSEFIDITPRVLPRADTDLARQTFNKWFKKISSEIDADTFPENDDNFIMYDLVSKYYRKYNVPEYSRYDTIGTQNQRMGMRRAQAKNHEAELPDIFHPYGGIIGVHNGLDGSHFANELQTEDDFIKWIQSAETYQYSILYWGISTSGSIKNTKSYAYQADYSHFVYYTFKNYYETVKLKYHPLEQLSEFEDYFYSNLPALTNTQKIYFLPETLAYFVELIHQCTRKELKEQGWNYEYKSGITYGLDICQIKSPVTGQITNMSTPLVADEKWEAVMKARKAYKEQFPWDD